MTSETKLFFIEHPALTEDDILAIDSYIRENNLKSNRENLSEALTFITIQKLVSKE